jgi:hypothetical protein
VFLISLGAKAQEAGKSAASPLSQTPSNAPKQDISSSSLFPVPVEDYTSPSLSGSPALGEIGSLRLELDRGDPQFTREIVRVQWRVGDPIDLYVIRPVGVKNPPVVIYQFDYPTETEAYQKAPFCRSLVKDGIAAVGFVPALTGQRYHDRGMKDWFVSQLPESLAGTAHDVQMVLNYLAKRGDFDMDRVGMFGDGSGATIAILAAAVDPRIKSLDLLDPWGDWPDWIAQSERVPANERADFLKPEWLKAAAPLDPMKWLPELKTPKIRLQFVRDISITPADIQKKIEAVAPKNAQIVHYDDSAAFSVAASGGKGFDWIKQQLRSGSPEYRARTQSSSTRSKNSQP